jgi:phosphoserine aminotransferase
MRSNTSVCLRFADPRVLAVSQERQTALASDLVARVEREGAGYDFGAYRRAPPGLRIWCGPTVEAADLALLTQWIDWAYGEVVSSCASRD